jgi:hypothetical protein
MTALWRGTVAIFATSKAGKEPKLTQDDKALEQQKKGFDHCSVNSDKSAWHDLQRLRERGSERRDSLRRASLLCSVLIHIPSVQSKSLSLKN